MNVQLLVSDVRVTLCCSGVICGVAQAVNSKTNTKQKIFFIVVIMIKGGAVCRVLNIAI